jgi:hypothetical protein
MEPIMLETEVSRGIEFDGTNWYVKVLGKKVGSGMNKDHADIVLWWINAGGLQGLLDVVTDIIEKAFDEKERKNGNK